MGKICDAVAKQRVIVSDGAWGTFLMAEGLGSNEPPEAWNLSHPDVVRKIAESYVQAGAQVVTTNSFGGSRIKLASYRMADKAAELNHAAAVLSREAAGQDVIVSASVGPTGKILMMGEISEEELYDVFREQIVALEAGGADAACIETFSALDEALIAVRAAKEHTQLEVVLSLTYDMDVGGTPHTMMGVNPAAMAEAALEAGVDVIGANCSFGPEQMIGVVQHLRAAAPDTPILVHPNAGLPEQGPEGVHYPEAPESMAAYVPDLVKAGANVIGGCCGTTPEHIRQIAAAVQQAVGAGRA